MTGHSVPSVIRPTDPAGVMEPLPGAYVAELARQLAFLSAVLGGFAATFLGMLLSLGLSGRLHSKAVGRVTTGVAAALVVPWALPGF